MNIHDLPQLFNATTKFKIGSFTRDISLASSNQSVSGVGFTPRAILFLASVPGTFPMSIGFDDNTDVGVLNSTNGTVFSANTTASIRLLTDAANFYDGTITALDVDGFTIVWTRTGVQAGTATIVYLAIR